MAAISKLRFGHKKESIAKCQKCFSEGHWTYECKNNPVFFARPSKIELLNNPELKPAGPATLEDVPEIPLITDWDFKRDPSLIEQRKQIKLAKEASCGPTKKRQCRFQNKKADTPDGDRSHTHDPNCNQDRDNDEEQLNIDQLSSRSSSGSSEHSNSSSDSDTSSSFGSVRSSQSSSTSGSSLRVKSLLSTDSSDLSSSDFSHAASPSYLYRCSQMTGKLRTFDQPSFRRNQFSLDNKIQRGFTNGIKGNKPSDFLSRRSRNETSSLSRGLFSDNQKSLSSIKPFRRYMEASSLSRF